MKNSFWLCFVSDGFEALYTLCNSREQLKRTKDNFIAGIQKKINTSLSKRKHSKKDMDVLLHEVKDYIDNNYIDSDLVPDTFMDVFELNDDIIKDYMQDNGFNVKNYRRDKKNLDNALYECGMYESNDFEKYKVDTISAIKEIVDKDKSIEKDIERMSLEEECLHNSHISKESKAMRNTLYVKELIDINDLDHMLWSGAKQRWDDATDDQKERVWDSLMDSVNAQMDSTGDIPTKTEVNDFIWFECDDIFNEDDEVDEARKRICRRCRKEARSGDAELETAEELRQYAINNPRTNKSVENVASSLARKAKRGIQLDKDVLANSSMMDSLVREVIRGYEHDFYPRGEKMDISTATRKLVKQKLAEDILETAEDMMNG